MIDCHQKSSLAIRTIHAEDVKRLKDIYYDVTRDTLKTGILKSRRNLSFTDTFIRSLLLGAIIMRFRLNFIFQIIFVQVVLLSPLIRVLDLYVYHIIAYILGYFVPFFSLLFEHDLRHMYDYYGPGNDQEATMFVAVINENIVGMIGISKANIHKTGQYKGLRQSNDGELRRLNVVPGFRGQKISSLLYDTVLEYARTKSFKRLILTTSSIQYVAFYFLYPKLGFIKIKEISMFKGLITLAFFAKSLNL